MSEDSMWWVLFEIFWKLNMLKPLPKRFAYAAFGHWEPNGGRMSNSASMRWTFTAPESRDRVRDRERRRLGRTTGCEWMRGAAIHETTRQERTQACRIDDMSYGEVGDSLLPVVSDVSTLTSAVFSFSDSSKFSKFFINQNHIETLNITNNLCIEY